MRLLSLAFPFPASQFLRTLYQNTSYSPLSYNFAFQAFWLTRCHIAFLTPCALCLLPLTFPFSFPFSLLTFSSVHSLPAFRPSNLIASLPHCLLPFSLFFFSQNIFPLLTMRHVPFIFNLSLLISLYTSHPLFSSLLLPSIPLSIQSTD